MIYEGFDINFRPFNELENIVQEKFPNHYPTFQHYHMEMIFKLEYIELIILRYITEKKVFEYTVKKLFELSKENVHYSTESARARAQEENAMLSTEFLQYTKQLELDIDSFFIFSRVLLDRVPYLLKPFFKGIVTTQEPAYRDFKKYIDWFEDNSELILDSSFQKNMKSFRGFFYDLLRAPRNEFIVHPGRKHIQSSIRSNGSVTRYIYEYSPSKNRWEIEESFKLPDIYALKLTIVDFLAYLNEYFSFKLRV